MRRKEAMRVIVTVKERNQEARHIVGHDLSGDYIIELPSGQDESSALAQAITVCRETLAIDDDLLYEFHGRAA